MMYKVNPEVKPDGEVVFLLIKQIALFSVIPSLLESNSFFNLAFSTMVMLPNLHDSDILSKVYITSSFIIPYWT